MFYLMTYPENYITFFLSNLRPLLVRVKTNVYQIYILYNKIRKHFQGRIFRRSKPLDQSQREPAFPIPVFTAGSRYWVSSELHASNKCTFV